MGAGGPVTSPIRFFENFISTDRKRLGLLDRHFEPVLAWALNILLEYYESTESDAAVQGTRRARRASVSERRPPDILQ